MSSHLPTHKSFLHIKCIIHWPNCTRLTRQIWGKLKPTYIIPTVQVDTLTNSKAAEPRRPSLTCCTITYHLHNHQISSSQSSNIIFTIIKYHLHNHQGRRCLWLLTILRPMKAITIMSNFLLVMIPNMIAWKKWKSHEEFFLIYHLGSPVRSWKRFHWFFPARLLHCGNVPAAIINGKEKERRGCLIRINQHHWDTEQCCKM